MRVCLLVPALLMAGVGLCAAAEKAAQGPLIVIDSAGKEQKLSGWKLVVGTRRLGWLAAPAEPGPKIPPGPEALEFRDEQSTTYVDGILTFVPLERLRAIDYDAGKQTVTIKVATDQPDMDLALTGTTRFKGSNKLVIEAEVDKGNLGVAAVKFLGGTKEGIQGVRFPMAKGMPPPKGRPASITVAEKQKSVQQATDLQPLYRLQDGTEQLVPYLVFKKTYKVELAKIQKLTGQPGTKADEPEWTMSMQGGESQTLTLLKSTVIDNKPATLLGLVGKVPAGYKLFPPHVIGEIQFDQQ